ncbi:MAG: GAF domain-containing protein, partial [Hymenobacteraceae bacterium]|nr:GAF domain-containing protein [Hymenobacteraceae bacterium]
LLESQLRNAYLLNPQLMIIQGRQFFGFIHEAAGKLILECEPYAQSDERARLEYTYKFASFQSELSSLETLEQQGNLLVGLIQSLLNYDRVMLYRFDQDWNGEVIAEKAKPGVSSYLHHHFPASDIPAPARALLEKKAVRQIPDVHAAAVDIVPYLNPKTGKPSNVIESELRNPSEIHLEYLQNMGVQATLSISLMVKGKLWGLVTCHHHTPVFINYWKRQVCKLFSNAFANSILTDEEKRDLHMLAHYRQLEEKLVEQINKCGSIEDGLFRKEYTLLDVSEATGAALFIDGKLYRTASAPAESEVHQIIDWLVNNNTDNIFCTNELSKHLPAAEPYREVASGLLALEISRYNKEYILYFKPEIKETRIWAGNPEKAVSVGEGLRIHPRKSFAAWAEIVKGKSLPWKQNEIEIAQLLLKDITAILLRNQATRLRNLNRDLKSSAEELRTKNQRLEDFAHIIAHNLRSPMSNIIGLYSLYQAEPSQQTSEEVMARMKQVIDNMAATIDDLNLILETSIDRKLASDLVRLDELIEKELQNQEAVLEETDATVTLELEVPELDAPKVYLESILHNLLSNALKYRASTRQPVIKVATWQQDGYTCLAVSDNGLGMDLNKVGAKVFGLYNTFHRHKDAKGLGLYLTRLQIESLGGTIEVQSIPDNGTTFTVRLPSEQASS